MPVRPSARVNSLIKEEKEARLRAFVARHLEARHSSGDSTETTTYRLLALSAESPAARALEALASELEAARVNVEVVLVRRAAAGDKPALAFADCRFATDIRLLDAHEQLVLDGTTAWIGDCMRRDPMKRDAYELFCDRCATTAENAARSFAHIWSAAGPTGSLATVREARSARPPNLFDPSLIAGADMATAPVLLRH